MTENYCPNCNDWDKYIPKIESIISMETIRGYWNETDEGIIFKYCPYCGSELKEL